MSVWCVLVICSPVEARGGDEFPRTTPQKGERVKESEAIDNFNHPSVPAVQARAPAARRMLIGYNYRQTGGPITA
jgi:hypothetical protein